MNATLSFRSFDSMINAYRVILLHGIYTVPAGNLSLKFHDEEDRDVAESILPSFHITPVDHEVESERRQQKEAEVAEERYFSDHSERHYGNE